MEKMYLVNCIEKFLVSISNWYKLKFRVAMLVRFVKYIFTLTIPELPIFR